MARLSIASLALLLGLWTSANASPIEQQVLGDHSNAASKVRYELKIAEIIPTVIDDFLPSILINISWANATAKLGNTVDPEDMQKRPTLRAARLAAPASSNMTYVLALTDPDAPSRDNPEWSEMCHWIASGNREENVKEIMEYKPPGPPPKTGKHRYVFLLFAPANGTNAELHLNKPSDRQHWGGDKERVGVRQWAQKNGLAPVGANFIYAQNDEQ